MIELSSETTGEVGTLMWALGVRSRFAGLGEDPHDPLHMTLLTFLLSSSVATPSEAAQYEPWYIDGPKNLGYIRP